MPSKEPRPRAEAVRRELEDRINSGTIGFCHLADGQCLSQVKARLQAAPSSTTLVVVGMGGSSLGARALTESLDGGMVRYLDNSDPETILRETSQLDLNKTLWNIVTKSGSTVETTAMFCWIYDRVVAALGPEEAKKRFIITTDPVRGPLRQLAKDENLPSLEIPSNVGGRFSVLSAVGLLPACYANVDAEGILAGARSVLDNKEKALDFAGALFHSLQGRNSLVWFGYGDSLTALGQWFAQLWSESVGKVTPAGEAVGAVAIAARGASDQHSQLQLYSEGPDDKSYLFVGTNFARDVCIPRNGLATRLNPALAGMRMSELLAIQRKATRESLNQIGRQTFELLVERTPRGLGAAFMFLELTVAYAGLFYQVEPFNQPGVELSKQLTHSGITEGAVNKESDETSFTIS